MKIYPTTPPLIRKLDINEFVRIEANARYGSLALTRNGSTRCHSLTWQGRSPAGYRPDVGPGGWRGWSGKEHTGHLSGCWLNRKLAAWSHSPLH